MLLDLIRCSGVATVVLFPGAALSWLVDRRSTWPQALAIGGTTAMAAAIVSGYYLLLFHISFAAFVVFEYALLAAAAVILRRRDRTSEFRGRTHSLLGLVILFVFISRSIPLFFGEVPQGLDACFHALIAQKILLSRAIPFDWTPFEAVRLNYPIGTHLLIAETTRWTGVPVHVVFKTLFPLVASLTSVAMYVVALRFSGSQKAAFFSCVAYSFIALWGSIDYYRWGGFPNAVGMLLVLAAVELVFARRAFQLGMLLAAVIMAHHHSALCALVLLLGYALFSRLISIDAAMYRTVIAGFPIAALLALGPVINYLKSSGEIGRASVLKFYEPLISAWEALRQLGIPLVALAAFGTALILAKAPRRSTVFLLFWITAFFSIFVFFEYVYRFGAYFFQREFYTAFTPSRFCTNLSYPLSILAGVGLARFVVFFHGAKRTIATAAVLCLSLAWAYFPLRAQCQPVPMDRDSFDWLAANAEANSFVVAESPWAPYFTWKETQYTPLPASEARNGDYMIFKRTTLNGDVKALRDFSERSGRPVYIVYPVELESRPDLEVFHGEKTRILKLR